MSSDVTEQLAPCPFCNSGIDNIDAKPFPGDRYNPPRSWIARCGNPDCGAEIIAKTAAEVIRRWNRRTAIAARNGAGEEGHAVVPIEPTEEIIDSVRYMITGISMPNPRNIGRFRQHCVYSGVDMSAWPEWFTSGKHDDEHMTKGAIAILFWRTMVGEAMKARAVVDALAKR